MAALTGLLTCLKAMIAPALSDTQGDRLMALQTEIIGEALPLCMADIALIIKVQALMSL